MQCVTMRLYVRQNIFTMCCDVPGLFALYLLLVMLNGAPEAEVSLGVWAKKRLRRFFPPQALPPEKTSGAPSYSEFP